MRVALDTSAYIAMCERSDTLRSVLGAAEEIYVPFPVLGELLAGIRGSANPDRKRDTFHRFLSQPGVNVLYADGRTCEIYADLAVELARAGKPIPVNDLWIASLTLQYDLVLCSYDRHFNSVPQVKRI